MRYLWLLLLAGLFTFAVMKCSEQAAITWYPKPMSFLIIKVDDMQEPVVQTYKLHQIRWVMRKHNER